MSKNMQSDSTSTDSVDVTGTADNQENVDKIRDILFGGQMRDYENRFREINDMIRQETSRLTTDVSARLDQLDNYMRQEFKALNEKIGAERKDRKQTDEDLTSAIAEARKSMDLRIADVDEVHGAAEQEIRNRLHEQATELLAMIVKNHELIENNLRTETRRLGDEKVARSDLAGLFTEVAMRLQRELDLPDEG